MPAGDGKSDMERLGVFQEMSYISIGDKYSSAAHRPSKDAAYQGRQMQVGVAKRGCFFDSSFRRIFEREALSDPVRLARRYRAQQAKNNLAKAFLPGNGTKKPSGSGSYYGTLSGPVQAMSALSITKKPRLSPGRNILTSPPKRGSGYSYPNVTLSRLEPSTSDPYDRAKEQLKREAENHRSKMKDGPFRLHLHPRDYFTGNPYRSDKPLPSSSKLLPSASKHLPPTQRHFEVPFKPPSPSKRIGGMKAGTFDIYPSHSADPYVVRRPKPVNQDNRVFRPTPGPKSTPVKSIITLNVNRAVHSDNYTSSIPAIITF